MERIGINMDLTQEQIYLLKNLSVLPGLPVRAKDLFTFLNIPQDLLVTYFDALHSLVPQWLEYNNAYYVLPQEKAREFRLMHKVATTDLFRLMSFFQKFFSTAEDHDKTLLIAYETYVLSILNNVEEVSVQLAQLHAAYAHYLNYMGRYDEAIMALNNAIEAVNKKQPSSPLVGHYLTEEAFIYLKQGNLEKARLLAFKARDSLQKAVGTMPEVTANLYFILGEVHFKTKEYRQAVHFFQRALGMIFSGVEKPDRFLLYTYFKLSEAFRQLKDYDRAKVYIDKALEYLNKLPPKEAAFFRDQINMQKKVIYGLSLFNDFKSKVVTYGLIALGFLLLSISLAALFYYLFK